MIQALVAFTRSGEALKAALGDTRAPWTFFNTFVRVNDSAWIKPILLEHERVDFQEHLRLGGPLPRAAPAPATPGLHAPPPVRAAPTISRPSGRTTAAAGD